MKVYIGLGANIGERETAIGKAIAALDGRIGTLCSRSSLYETRPVGFLSEHLFLNAAAVYETTLSAHALLQVTQEVERELGRTVKSEGGVYHDRPIDIDILVFGDVAVADDVLTLPHPRLAERRFVLEPLCEIAPQLVYTPAGVTVSELLHRLNRLDIFEVTAEGEAPAEAAEALNRLLPALTAHAGRVSEADVRQWLGTGLTHLYMGRDEQGLVQATATLCLCASPTGCKAWVEDVVTSPECRGRGYAGALIAHLQCESVRLGAKSLNLTSRPDREAANRLYRRAGFEPRTTNVYRWTAPERGGNKGL